MFPTSTFPKATLAGVTASCTAVVASPETDSVVLVGAVGPDSDEPCVAFMVSEAVPFILTIPLTVPVAWGAKVTLKVVLCPGPRVKGKVRPVTEKAALVTES